MKIAVLNSNGIQSTEDGILRYYYAVSDDYDFSSNQATDVTSIELLNEFNNIHRIDFINFRNSLISLYTATTFSSFTLTEKQILSKSIIPTKTERETIYTTNEIKEFAISCQVNINKAFEDRTLEEQGNISSLLINSTQRITNKGIIESISATSISAITYYGDGSNLINVGSPTANTFTTGATLINNTVFFHRNNGLSAYTVNLSSISSTGTSKSNGYMPQGW